MGKITFSGSSILRTGQIKISSLEFITTFDGEKISYSTPVNWTSPDTIDFTVSFLDAPTRDEFFSLGGQTRLALSLTDYPANLQNQSIAQLFQAIGMVIFAESETTRTGTAGVNTAVGYSSLTTSYQTIFTADSVAGGAYVDDQVTIEAKLEGNDIVFQITTVDGFDNLIDEVASGTFNLKVDERRYYTTQSPVYTIASAGQSCIIASVDFYPDQTFNTTTVSFWDFMEQSSPQIWLHDNSPATNADTALGRYDDRANPGRYVVSRNNVGGLRSIFQANYPWGASMSGQSNNDWTEGTNDVTYGNLGGATSDDFTIAFRMRSQFSTTTTTFGRIVGCYEADSDGEWALIVGNNNMFLRYFTTGGVKKDTGTLISTPYALTDRHVLVITKSGTNIRARIYGGTASSTFFTDGDTAADLLVQDNTVAMDATGWKRNSEFFKMKWRPGTTPGTESWSTAAGFEVGEYSQWDRALNDGEVTELAEWLLVGKQMTTPIDIQTYEDFRLHRGATINYLKFTENDNTQLIAEQTKSMDGMTLNGATDTASNRFLSKPLPATIGGGYGQTISSSKYFENTQLGTPYFDFSSRTWVMEFLVCNVNSITGNRVDIIKKNDDATNIGNYLNIYIDSDDKLKADWYVDYNSGQYDTPVAITLAERGGEGGWLFEDDEWHTVRLNNSGRYFVCEIDGVVTNGADQIYTAPYYTQYRYGYDNPTFSVPSRIGGGGTSPYQEDLGTTISSDDFTGANGTLVAGTTTDVGGDTWIAGLGNATIQSNRVTFPASNDMIKVDCGSTEGIVQVVHNPGGADNRFSILMADGNGLDNATRDGYYFNIRSADAGTGTAWIGRFDAGVVTWFDGGPMNVPYGLNDDHLVRAVMDGNDLKLYIDGVLQYSTTDPGVAKTGTHVGIQHNQFIDGNARFDDFLTTTVGAPIAGGPELGIAHLTVQSRSLIPLSLSSTNLGGGAGGDYNRYNSSWLYTGQPYSYYANHRNALLTDGILPKNRYWLWADIAGNLTVDRAGSGDNDLFSNLDPSTRTYVDGALYHAYEGRVFNRTASDYVRDQDAAGNYPAGRIDNSNFAVSIVFSVDAVATNQYLAGKWHLTNAPWQCWKVSIDSNTSLLNIDFREFDDTNRGYQIDMAANGIAADGQMHWLYIENDTTTKNEFGVYLNGTKINSQDNSAWSGFWKNSTDTGFHIGTLNTDTANYGWQGAITEVTLYDGSIPTYCGVDAANDLWNQLRWNVT